MQDYKDIRFSNYFVNLTNYTVRLYERSTGEIWIFPPSNNTLPENPSLSPDTPIIHYIVDQKQAEALRMSGRSLDDIAIVNKIFHGRHGVKVSYLVWGQNPNIKIHLYNNRRLSFKYQ